ncbi:phytosulfokines 2-like [Miscanthus floridulus]|uniref:phytosulfokines 2-like n=1 Tax=Miscanthus floridulus TaxID=154761 RepID=UPI00345A6288
MASGSKRLKSSLLVVAALLLLICICTTMGQAARPEPGSKDHMPQRAVSAAGVAGHEKSGSAAGVEMHQDEPEEMREREDDGDEREECLMRRTLVAHTDYIYTQGKHN